MKKADPFYQSSAWLQVREAALMRDGYICQDCLDAYRCGEYLPHGVQRATMVHHLIPVKKAPALALSLWNMRSLCSMHHELRHPERHMAKKKKEAPRMRVYKL